MFNPLSVPTEAEQAATQGAKSSYYGNLINAGVVSPEEVRQALRQDENSGFTDIAEDLPEDTGNEPPEENSGNTGGQEKNNTATIKTSEDEFQEEEHPRNKKGEFTNKGTGENTGNKTEEISQKLSLGKARFKSKKEIDFNAINKIKLSKAHFEISNLTADEASKQLKTYTPETIAGVKRGTPMSFEQADHNRANPNFHKGVIYQVNCQSSVIAFIARLRGYDVMAKCFGNKESMELALDTRRAFIIDNKGTHPAYIERGFLKNSKEAIDFLEETIKPGEIYCIETSSKNKGKKQKEGHIMVIQRLNKGKLVIYDPQDGKRIFDEGFNNFFAKISLGYLDIFRVDNAAFNPKYADKVLEKSL